MTREIWQAYAYILVYLQGQLSVLFLECSIIHIPLNLKNLIVTFHNMRHLDLDVLEMCFSLFRSRQLTVML